jgi:hypothetical protein
LYDAVNAIGSGTLAVSVVSAGTPVAGALVVATPVAGGNPVVAAPPAGDRAEYLAVGVGEGQWRVTVQATGFADFTTDAAVTAAPGPPVVAELVPVGPVVPAVFGQPLQTAFATLVAAGLAVDRIVDALGTEVGQTPIPADYQNVPVLVQLPVAGTRLPPTDRVQLVVAATVSQAPVVTMPNLAGLTQAEAVRVLEQLGLRVGRITVVGG